MLDPPAVVIKGTEALGAELFDGQGAELGKISDLLLDDQGRLVVAVLSPVPTQDRTRGQIPLPAELITPRELETDGSTYLASCAGFVFAGTPDQLASAPRFHEDDPLEDAKILAAYAYFDVPVFWKRSAPIPSRDDDATDDGAMNQEGALDRPVVEQEDGEAADMPSPKVPWRLVSDTLDRKVFDDTGARLGEIRDVAISVTDRELQRDLPYVVLEISSLLGFDVKLFAVPWDALTATEDGTFQLDVAASELEEAEGFGDDWPIEANDELFAKAGGAPVRKSSG